MTRKDEIRQEIARLEARKLALIAEAKKIKDSPAEIIHQLLIEDRHKVYSVLTNTFLYPSIYFYLKRSSDLSTVTEKIYKKTGYVLYAFNDKGNKESEIYFRKFS